jgi:2-methylisocitrate lyase-like PEP mutase family enzyme
MSSTPVMTQAQKASRLLELHHGPSPLVLINAWDAGSAAMVEHCELPAVASSSAAVANAMGYPDGQHLPWTQMLEVVGRMARAVSLPLTADIEAGFSADLQQLESSIAEVIAAGAVGVNLEDALPGHEHFGPLYPVAEQVERIQAARRVAEKAGIHLVINARVDAYWQAGVQPDEAMRNTLDRGRAYLAAGADCIFVPGLRNPDHIRTVIDHLRPVHPEAPVNILAVPGVPPIPELARLGVKRVSYGSGPHRAAMGLLRRMAEEARTSGTYASFTEGAVPYAEMNGLFKR